MKAEWPAAQCILCLRRDRLSEEHLIPRSIGGTLTCRFLCQGCNSNFGHGVDASVRRDPSVLLAIRELRNEIPILYQQLVESHGHVSVGEVPRVKGFVHDSEFHVSQQRLEDRSLVLPSVEARIAIETTLRRRESTESTINAALRKFDMMPPDRRISIAPGLDVDSRTPKDIELDLSGSKLLDSRLPLKIAFEFLALLLAATLNFPFLSTRNCALRVGDGCGRVHPVGLANKEGAAPDAWMGDKDVVEALSRPRGQQGGVVEALRHQPTDDPPLDRHGAVGPRPRCGSGGRGATAAQEAEAGSVQGDHQGAAGGVSAALGAAPVRRSARGGLPGGLQPREGLRRPSAAARSGRADRPLRDAAGPPGPGGLRHVHAAVGPAARAAGGAGPLEAAVAAVLPSADDARSVRWAGGRVRALRRGAPGDAVRPDARGGALGRPHRRRGADPQPGVPALRGALGVHAALVPAVPGPDEGVSMPIENSPEVPK